MTKQPYKVRLASVGNPDFGQDPRRSMYGAERNKTVGCDSLEAAAELCQQFITTNDLGGGNWAGGEITDASGKVVAHVSYNGRIWEGPRRSWNATTKELCAS